MEKKIQKVLRTEKPWGHELLWLDTDKVIAKILVIKKNQRLSLQYHKVKSEVMVLSRGSVILVLEGEEIVMLPECSYHIGPGMVHRLVAYEDSEVVEVSMHLSVQKLEKDDIVRLEDDYGRI